MWKDSTIKETINRVRSTRTRSSLIPLFSKGDTILRVLDFYRPDIIHFCEDLTHPQSDNRIIENLIRNQERIKNKFPDVLIMRSIPIIQAGTKKNMIPALKFARMFEALSDYFLTDTILANHPETGADHQPVSGFIGITGRTCDWDIAAKLVEYSAIPVILGGGLTPNNVYTGIKRVRPAGVDSCTGTNASDDQGRPVRFRKDLEKVAKLIEAVRKAQQEN